MRFPTLSLKKKTQMLLPFYLGSCSKFFDHFNYPLLYLPELCGILCDAHSSTENLKCCRILKM